MLIFLLIITAAADFSKHAYLMCNSVQGAHIIGTAFTEPCHIYRKALAIECNNVARANDDHSQCQALGYKASQHWVAEQWKSVMELRPVHLGCNECIMILSECSQNLKANVLISRDDS